LAAVGAGSGGIPAPADQAAGLRAQNAALAQDEHGTLLDLYALQSRLDASRERLATLRTEEADLDRRRVDASLGLAVARRSLVAAERRMGAQLRLLYEQGDSTNALAIVLGASSMDDAVTRLDDLDRTTSQNRSV